MPLGLWPTLAFATTCRVCVSTARTESLSSQTTKSFFPSAESLISTGVRYAGSVGAAACGLIGAACGEGIRVASRDVPSTKLATMIQLLRGRRFVFLVFIFFSRIEEKIHHSGTEKDCSTWSFLRDLCVSVVNPLFAHGASLRFCSRCRCDDRFLHCQNLVGLHVF